LNEEKRDKDAQCFSTFYYYLRGNSGVGGKK